MHWLQECGSYLELEISHHMVKNLRRSVSMLRRISLLVMCCYLRWLQMNKQEISLDSLAFSSDGWSCPLIWLWFEALRWLYYIVTADLASGICLCSLRCAGRANWLLIDKLEDGGLLYCSMANLVCYGSMVILVWSDTLSWSYVVEAGLDLWSFVSGNFSLSLDNQLSSI
jgi:hypothetical protein